MNRSQLGAVLVAAVLTAPAHAGPAPGTTVAPGVDSTEGNTVTRWSTFVDDSGITACTGEAVQRRLFAAVHVAASDALTAIVPTARPIALGAHEPGAYARAAVASAARTGLVDVLGSEPRISGHCRETGIATVERAFAASALALPDRPAVWVGVALGSRAGAAAASWTALHPSGTGLTALRAARARADASGLSMWESAALLARYAGAH